MKDDLRVLGSLFRDSKLRGKLSGSKEKVEETVKRKRFILQIVRVFFPPENEIWECHANNTNIAEAAHAQANREGKQLKLLTAIMRCLDERIYKIAETHDRYGVPYNRRDKSEIKRQTRAMRRKSGKQKEILKESKKKVPIQDINNQEKPEERGVKQRQQQAEI
ncbi:hypothetical protein RhiirA1_462637 [Rhizophagus irregularis]|uniref:Uncharacterized protein n=1 Tax=Rhizophagus irregularis TaxID=588596 RepID=A0A2N0RLV5_9GLOM|nr:hypothetical protein RhiirA1_462637 [Rhizophagus irregularis]CAB4481501.1 unnamed protein product [Rhizophagus irregularis]